MTQIDQLKKAIQAAVPEILSFRLGVAAEVNAYDGKGNHPATIIGGDLEHYIVTYNDMWHFIGIVPKREVTILGRPIRQDDCAQVVKDKHGLADRWTSGYLDDQSEETIKWIYENKN